VWERHRKNGQTPLDNPCQFPYNTSQLWLAVECGGVTEGKVGQHVAWLAMVVDPVLAVSVYRRVENSIGTRQWEVRVPEAEWN